MGIVGNEFKNCVCIVDKQRVFNRGSRRTDAFREKLGKSFHARLAGSAFLNLSRLTPCRGKADGRRLAKRTDS